MDRNLIFQHILTNICWKKTKFHCNTLKPFPDLRHPCVSQTWQFSRRVGGLAVAAPHLETAFVLIKPLPDLRHLCGLGMFEGHISASGKEMRHLCGIFWLGWFMDVGRDEGVAPSMWAFPAWFWRMSGSCAIYVPKRQLDVEEKIWVQTSAEDCKK